MRAPLQTQTSDLYIQIHSRYLMSQQCSRIPMRCQSFDTTTKLPRIRIRCRMSSLHSLKDYRMAV